MNIKLIEINNTVKKIYILTVKIKHCITVMKITKMHICSEISQYMVPKTGLIFLMCIYFNITFFSFDFGINCDLGIIASQSASITISL